MKQLLYLSLVIFGGAFVGSCGLISEPSELNDSDSLVLDSLVVEELEFTTKKTAFVDSLEQNGVMLRYSVEIDVPVTGPKALLDSVKTWMNNTLGGSYNGVIDFNNEMLRHYAELYYDDNSDVLSIVDFIGCSLDLKIQMTDNTDGFVSYEVEGYDYTGGAHGMPISYGTTFVKETGSTLSWDMFSDTTNIAPLFKQSVVQYFAKDSITSLDEVLFEEAAAHFPLPTQTPWLVSDGVKFCYGAYEIAPYAAGMPSGVIPTNKISKYLVEDVRKLLK